MHNEARALECVLVNKSWPGHRLYSYNMGDAAALTSAFVALLVYHNTLHAGFVYDDT